MAVGDLPLCRVLLINDANYPWLLLVPRRLGASEIVDLDYIEQAQLMDRDRPCIARRSRPSTGCDKINVAALGNVVPQLHVHVIARSRGDAAWPRPVWDAVPARAYDPSSLQRRLDALRQRLSLSPL